MPEPRMTDQEMRDVALKHWEVNKVNAEHIARTVLKNCGMPPILADVPGVAKFFATMQRVCFQWGALSVIHHTARQADNIMDLVQEAKADGFEVDDTIRDINPGMVQ